MLAPCFASLRASLEGRVVYRAPAVLESKMNTKVEESDPVRVETETTDENGIGKKSENIVVKRRTCSGT